MKHRIDTKLIDVFISHARADAARVNTWARRLRQGGVEVWFDEAEGTGAQGARISQAEAARRCEVLIWIVSKFAKASQSAGTAALEASRNGKAVVIVALDRGPVPPDFDLSQPRVTVVNGLLIGRPAAWDAILKAVRDQGVPWVPPEVRRRRSRKPNVYRHAAAYAWLRLGLVLPGLLIAGSLAFTQFTSRSPRPPPPVMPATPPPRPRLLTVTADAPPKQPAAVFPSPTPQELADPKTLRAINHVRACIEAATRENGLAEAQMDKIGSYWADPVVIDQKGPQSAGLMRASLVARQREVPKWRETVHFINATGTDQPGLLEVVTQTSFTGEKAGGEVVNGTVLAHYWVNVANLEQPKITRLWVEELKEL